MTNKAAERLRAGIAALGQDIYPDRLIALVDAALANERKATVRRIQAAIIAFDARFPEPIIKLDGLDAILDAEAQR